MSQFERNEIEAAVDGLIAMLDERDGDADIEPNGDEIDGNIDEDDFMRHAGRGPGCELADPGASEGGSVWHGEDDEPDNWQGRRRLIETMRRNRCTAVRRGGQTTGWTEWRLPDADIAIGTASELLS